MRRRRGMMWDVEEDSCWMRRNPEFESSQCFTGSLERASQCARLSGLPLAQRASLGLDFLTSSEGHAAYAARGSRVGLRLRHVLESGVYV
eukprot:269000-Pyramimonas_sp.AAC.1